MRTELVVDAVVFILIVGDVDGTGRAPACAGVATGAGLVLAVRLLLVVVGGVPVTSTVVRTCATAMASV